ncbi:MAG: hypothetical protein JW891_16220 [Candidatus Lokiarchaeota archaeon]|nr:hypothetical protein [Candidatus Lokiarchaeota archaeon]
MEKDQLLFGAISIGLTITLFILHILFVSPFQKNGILFSLLLLILCVIETIFLSRIKYIYEKNSNKAELLGKINNTSQYGRILTASVIISYLIALFICILPSQINPSGLTAKDILVYSLLQLTDSPEGIIFLLQYILIPGFYVAAIIIGTFIFDKNF